MSEEHTYDSLLKLFRKQEYFPTKFVCRQCGTTVRYKDLECSECENTLVWCESSIVQRSNKVSYEIWV